MHFSLSSDHCPFSLPSIPPHSVNEEIRAARESLTAGSTMPRDKVRFLFFMYLFFAILFLCHLITALSPFLQFLSTASTKR